MTNPIDNTLYPSMTNGENDAKSTVGRRFLITAARHEERE